MRTPRRIVGGFAVLALLGSVLVAPGGALRAATPGGGTVSDTNPSLSYTAGPFLVGNPTGFATGVPTCSAATPCDDFALTVTVPSGYDAGHQVNVGVQWPNSTADFDLFVLDAGGNVVATSATSADPEGVVLPALSAQYTVRVVPFNPLAQSYTANVSIGPRPLQPPPSGLTPPGYQNYAAPNGLGTSAGEPSIGANWQTGKVMFQASLQTLRVGFNDTTSPATATWEDVSAPNTSLLSLDAILFTDHTTGRTQVSQLTGVDSLSAVSADDGQTWTPSQGGGIPSGVDHQTVGGGPYAQPVPPGALAPHAVYYCSQEDVTAFCARSDDGGLTFGPGIPIYTTQCGGIHGHVKVAPDGTVYVPNRSCDAHQGVAVSTDNGMTWAVHEIPGSTAGDTDPSVGIGSDGTAYFGYENGDHHPRIAVSHDRGTTWVHDQGVGLELGLQNSVFPAVVAGDGDRAAFAFHGSPTGGDYNNTAFPGVWHLYVAHTYDGGQTWATTDVTPNDPVQRGSICTAGTTCTGNTRNLLDFFDATVDAQGRVLVGYADGCIGACVQGGANSYTNLATIARQTSGKRLFSQYDQADLTPTALSADFSHPQTNTLRATVLNQGTAPAGSFVVRFLDNGTQVGESAPLTLADGQSAVASYAWTAHITRGAHTITAVVDPYNRVPESNENNNQISATLNLR